MNNNQNNGYNQQDYNQNNNFNNQYPNNQYNQNNNMNNTYYQSTQYNQNNDYNNNYYQTQQNNQQPMNNYQQQYNQQPASNYNQQYQQYNQDYQYHESYNTKKEADGSGFGGALGTIFGVIVLVALCYLGYYLVTNYFDSNKTVVCTGNGGGFDIKYEFNVNNKKKEIKSMSFNYTINYNDGLTRREKTLLKELFYMGAFAGEYANYTGVSYTYNGPTSTSQTMLNSEIEDFKDKDVSLEYKIVRKKVTNKKVLEMFEEYDGKEAYELVNYLSDSSNNPYGLTCYER